MKNGEFLINTMEGVVEFCQKSHGKDYVSTSKTSDLANFNIGIGQLIAMKRNEIVIRKDDIKTMLDVIAECQSKLSTATGTGKKLWTNFIQLASDKVNMSRNHIRELREDLNTLYDGSYGVKPYSEIVDENRKYKNTYDPTNKETSTKRPNKYCVPTEIVNGTHMYEYVNGSVALIPVPENL